MKGWLMAEQILGDLHVSNDVLADIAGNAAMECYGIVGMTAPNAADGIAKILPVSRLRRGITVTQAEKGVRVNLYVIVEYGINVSTVSRNLVDTVAFALKHNACIPIDGIEVHVQGIKLK